jgi:hypothetical protein
MMPTALRVSLPVIRMLSGTVGRMFALALAMILASSVASAYRGRVIDAVTGAPLAGAVITADGRLIEAGADGTFELAASVRRLAVRLPGYERRELSGPVLDGGIMEIRLPRFSPKALYLSFYGIGTPSLRNPALELIGATELNALVIDIKGDRGWIAYPSKVALAAQIGAQRTTTIRDLKALIDDMKRLGVYTIARIVVFKDDPLAKARADFAIRTGDGRVWHDRESLAWVDPFREEVWDYNISIALEAAAAGFDEIQFDYLRFPDARGLVFSKPSTEANRVAAITGFLREARKRLAPFNVFLAADIFGYVCWNLNDTEIGQRLDSMLPHVDYLSPMLYPSGFHAGIPDCRDPLENPHEIVYRSLKRAQERTGAPAHRFRPWLQAFRDYAFDRRRFGEAEIRAQIDAAEEFGANGWMLWNATNVYSAEGLRK